MLFLPDLRMVDFTLRCLQLCSERKHRLSVRVLFTVQCAGRICWGAREGDVHLRFAVSAIIILIPAKVSELRIKLTDAFCYVAHVVEMSDGQSTFVLNVSQAGNTYLLLLVGNPYWQLHGQHPCFFWACCYSWRCFFWGGRFRTGGITCPRTAFLC